MKQETLKDVIGYASYEIHQRILNSECDHKISVYEAIALAYTVKELLEILIEQRTKLTFEAANGFLTSYYLCKRALKNVKEAIQIDPDMGRHQSLFDFFSKHVSNDFDRLHFETEEACAEIEEREKKEAARIQEEKNQVIIVEAEKQCKEIMENAKKGEARDNRARR